MNPKHLFVIILSAATFLACEDKKPLPKIETSCLELAQSSLIDEKLVNDASAQVKDDTIYLVLMVNAATNIETAKRLGDNFLRLTKSLCKDGEAPSKRIGKSNYNYQIGVFASGSESEIARGAKIDVSPVISW